jgi:hypothetical protein
MLDLTPMMVGPLSQPVMAAAPSAEALARDQALEVRA